MLTLLTSNTNSLTFILSASRCAMASSTSAWRLSKLARNGSNLATASFRAVITRRREKTMAVATGTQVKIDEHSL